MDIIIYILAIIGAWTIVAFIAHMIEQWSSPHEEVDYYTLKIKKNPYAFTAIKINGGEVLLEGGDE